MAVAVDTSVWIAWLLAEAGSERYDAIIGSPEQLIVPAITIYELVRWSLVNADDEAARAATELMTRGEVVDLDAEMAIAAALLVRESRLAMADSIILATARARGAELWTQDADFEGLAGVRYYPKA